MPPRPTELPLSPAPAAGVRRAALPVVALALLALLVTTLAAVAITVISAARAYVGGESQWTRSQKAAVMALLRFSAGGDEADWRAYEQAIAVPLGDRRARLELDRPDPDMAVVREGFLAGLNHPDDIGKMALLYRSFRHVPFMADAIAAWTDGDHEIDKLITIAQAVRTAVRENPSGSGPTLPALREQLRTLDASVTRLEMRFSATLGEAARLTYWLLLAVMALGASSMAAVAIVITRRALNAQARQTAALRHSETLFRSLWETTGDAVLIVDRQHRMLFANPAAHALFGHPPGSLIGQSLALIQPAHLHAAHREGVDRYLASQRRKLNWGGTEVPARHADGHELPVEVRFSEFELDGERLFVGFLRDITARKQAEREVQEANERLEQRVRERTHELSEANRKLLEVDQLKSEFLATMSHELRTPLNAILGFTTLLREGMSGPLNPEQLRQLGFVQNSGQHLLALINDLLDLSRIESGRMEVMCEPFDLVEVAHEVITQMRPLADRKALHWRLELPAALPMLGDRRKTYQVLLNLVGNAVKFTPTGEIGVRAEATPSGSLTVTVSDTGVGIAAEHLPSLFEAFRQVDGSAERAHEGTGLGLYLCRKLLDLMGGTISVHSERGRGSRFAFTLPMHLPGASGQELPAARAAAAVPF